MNVTLLLLSLLFSAPEATYSLSAGTPCAEEDGSTQVACVWSDGSGDTVINLAYGKVWFTI